MWLVRIARLVQGVVAAGLVVAVALVFAAMPVVSTGLVAAPLQGRTPVQDPPAPVQVAFLDVGQADAVLVRAPEGQTALVDAGRRSPVDALHEMDVSSIDLLVATHAHADHIGGMTAVLQEFAVRYFMDNGMPHTTRTYERLMEELERRPGIVYLNPEPRTIALGSVDIEVLPLPAPRGRDQNNRSVALVVRHGRFAALLSGDSEVRQLNFLTGRGVVPRVALLKAPHHGSHNGFTPSFLRAAQPRVVVVSVGRNGYGHPRPEALAAFSAVAEDVYRTDRDGTVTVLGFPDGRYTVSKERP